MYLLDTNVVSGLRTKRPHGAVLAWLHTIPDAESHLSVVTLGEILSGIEPTRDQDPAKANEICACADLVRASISILPMVRNTFREWARLMHRKLVLLRDAN